MTGTRLDELAERAWELYDHAVASADGLVVRPSMPILFFGEEDAYRRSPLKVVTVGLNPSLKEFPTHEPWLRFPDASRGSAYRGSLNAYFRTSPYRQWFACYEPLLNGIGASYYQGPENTALHTDICSPVATTPTWSRLGSGRGLVGDGFELWRDLVEALAPDLVLASVARRYLLRVTPEPADTWPTVHVLDRENPYHARMRELSVGGHRVPVVFGRAAEKPFGTVSNRDKLTIGAAIRRRLDGE